MLDKILIMILAGLLAISGCNDVKERKAIDFTGVLYPGKSEPLRSPSNRFVASFVEFNDSGVKSYKLIISSQRTDDIPAYTTDITFRDRDANYVVWADDEEEIWAYNSDIGVFYWIFDDNDAWVKNTVTENSSIEIPRKLIELML